MAQIHIPGYEIHEQIGRGGMATVYKALHVNLDREVAIKVIDTNRIADESFSERFVREARISARLSHPHILQIYDVNVHGSLNYISMELLHGGDLEDIIRGAMPQRTIYQVMAQMTTALDYAASKGYVHRDIKPSNIMRRSAEDFVLADFGIAKAADSSTQMTQAGLLVGTPSYMSPEQAEGGPLDGRSDLYSLAVVCYEMLTKSVPYDADSAVSVAVKHLTEKIPKLPRPLSAYQPFLNRGLAKKPEDRFQSGREMYEAFCEVRHNFADDDVLTPPREIPERPTPPLGTELIGDGTLVWGEASGADSATPSGSYRLTPTQQDDGLLSGIRTEGRAEAAHSRSAGPGIWALVAVLVAGASAGGWYYWQSQLHQPPTAGTPDTAPLLAEARDALASGDLVRAREAVARLEASDPQHAALDRLEGELATADRALQRQEADNVQRLSERNLALLLKDGQAALDAGEPASAGERFSTALQLDPDSPEAQDGLAASVAALATGTEEALASGEFERARGILASALALAPEQEDLLAIEEGLPAREAEWQLQQSLAAAEAHLKQTELLAAAGGFAGILANNPDNQRAAEGLQQAVDGLVDQARASAGQHRFDAAGNALDSALQYLPGDAGARDLADQLPGLEQRWKNEQAALARREADANERANAALRAIGEGDLRAARLGYDALEQAYPDMSVTRDIRQRLLDAYARAVKDEIEVQSYDTALDLIAEAQVIAPELALWSELREEVDYLEANDRRRLGAY